MPVYPRKRVQTLIVGLFEQSGARLGGWLSSGSTGRTIEVRDLALGTP